MSLEYRIRTLEGSLLPPPPAGPPWSAAENELLEILALILQVPLERLPPWPGVNPCHGLAPCFGHVEQCLKWQCEQLEALAIDLDVHPALLAADEAMLEAAIRRIGGGGKFSYYWEMGRCAPLPRRCADVGWWGGRILAVECATALYSPFRNRTSPQWVIEAAATIPPPAQPWPPPWVYGDPAADW